MPPSKVLLIKTNNSNRRSKYLKHVRRPWHNFTNSAQGVNFKKLGHFINTNILEKQQKRYIFLEFTPYDVLVKLSLFRHYPILLGTICNYLSYTLIVQVNQSRSIYCIGLGQVRFENIRPSKKYYTLIFDSGNTVP